MEEKREADNKPQENKEHLHVKFHDNAPTCRFYLNVIITYLAPIFLLPLIIFHNTRKSRCAYVLLLVFANWVSRILPLGVTALMPLLYLPALKILPYDVVLGEYMNNHVLLTLAAITMSLAIETTHLHQRLSMWVLLKCGDSLRQIMAGYTIATFCITLVLKNSATLDIMAPVVDATVQEIHYTYIRNLYHEHIGREDPRKLPISCMAMEMNMKDEDMVKITTKFIKIRKVLLITVAYTAALGSVGALSGTVTNYVTKMLIETKFPKNTSVTFMPWATAFFPVALTAVAAAFFILYYSHMRRLTLDTNWNAISASFQAKYLQLGHVRRSEKVVIVVFGVVILLWSTRKPIFFRGWANLFDQHTIDDSSIAFMAVAVLFAIPMKGADIHKRILSWSVVSHKMAWGMLLTFGGGLALANASEQSELSEDFAELVNSMHIQNPMLMQLLLSVSAAIVTEFTPNDAAANMLIPVVVTLACGHRINPLYFVFPVMLSVTQACILPASSSVIAIISDEGHVTVKDLLVPGLLVKCICQMFNILFINTLGNFVFDLSHFPDWADNCTHTSNEYHIHRRASDIT
ncbi:Na(+)/citrate cotransporter-like [Ornithodoros turicata]|uniref:Na(+)/citrate cotransporter-like n=1 Tax=Ornithodoros turicata TaxID=34597 RepID=UPI0031387257